MISNYRLRLFGRLVGELEIESDNFEITLNEPSETRLIWGESEAESENASENEFNASQPVDGHAADA